MYYMGGVNAMYALFFLNYCIITLLWTSSLSIKDYIFRKYNSHKTDTVYENQHY